MKRNILPPKFYLSKEIVALSQTLLGKFLVTEINGDLTAGMIIETEAYNGIIDKASHAYNNRRTRRTETLYCQGGVAYVYLCYGLHHLFNVVTGPKDNPQAILIRAIKPTDGISIMLKRRKLTANKPSQFTQGPGTLTQALGITTHFDGFALTDKPVWIEDRGIVIPKNEIVASPRVGIDYAQEHRDLPWRFQIFSSPSTRC